MFGNQRDHRLPADLVADDATAQAHARALQPAIGRSAAPAIVTAQIHGQGLFLRILVDEGLPPGQRELAADLARALVVGLLRSGTGRAGWTWDAAARAWSAAVAPTDDLTVLVPDHVPAEWVQAA